jgi:hypothetical protein
VKRITLVEAALILTLDIVSESAVTPTHPRGKRPEFPSPESDSEYGGQQTLKELFSWLWIKFSYHYSKKADLQCPFMR